MTKFQKIAFTVCSIIAALSSGSNALADTKKKTNLKAVPCPQVIGDRRDGVYRAFSKRDSNYPFKCYENKKAAEKGGFESLNQAQNFNYTGWYRLRLHSVKDTCSPGSTGAGMVLFLQVREKDAGVFGEFCPTFGSFSGARSGTGFVITGRENFSESPSKSICDDGKIQKTQVVEMTRLADNKSTFVVNYKVVQSCTSVASGANTCSREYTGVGNFESHEIWKEVGISDNLTQLSLACSTALTRCVDCHESLGNLRSMMEPAN